MSKPPPKSVAILGLGPSVSQYLELSKRLGGRHVDEVWGINALGDVFACDVVFHMDDVRIQERRAAARPESNIARMLAWLRKHPGPVITSRAHPDYPGLIEFPLAAVLQEFGGWAYFNNTSAYAVAYAVFLGVERLEVYGNDFTYADAHHAEKGRGCVEFWLGVALARGIDVKVPHASSLLDSCCPEQRLYGYDTLALEFGRDAHGNVEVKKTPRDEAAWPTADQVERAYDHTRHPNALVEGAPTTTQKDSK